MRVTIEIPDCQEVKYCKLCGRAFDRDEYEKTMNEQTEGRRQDCGKYFNQVTRCGLFCAWLSDPDMVSTLIRSEKQKIRIHDRKIQHVEQMKDDIAKRVAKYLLSSLKD